MQLSGVAFQKRVDPLNGGQPGPPSQTLFVQKTNCAAELQNINTGYTETLTNRQKLIVVVKY